MAQRKIAGNSQRLLNCEGGPWCENLASSLQSCLRALDSRDGLEIWLQLRKLFWSFVSNSCGCLCVPSSFGFLCRVSFQASILGMDVLGQDDVPSFFVTEHVQGAQVGCVREPSIGGWDWWFGGLNLDCYWVGSLDFSFLGNQGGFHKTPKKLNFLQGVNSNQGTLGSCKG